MASLDDLARSKYIALTTFRKDGTAVSTPVWLVREGDHLLVTTQGDSGKVKRIRNSASVMVGPCTSRGKATGVAVPATARVIEGQEAQRIAGLVVKRYGLLGRLLARRGDASKRVGIEITVI